MAARGKFVNGEDRTPSPATVLSAQSTPPVGAAPAKFLDAAEGKKRAQAALDTSDDADRPRKRLQEAAEKPGAIHTDMAKYARFLMKQGNEEDHKTGTKWLRRASENLRTKLSPTVTDQNRLGGYNR